MKLEGRVAVVTGGASGLGLGSVEHLVRDKLARVAIFDLPGSAGAEVADRLGAERTMFCAVDVADEGAVAEAVAAVRLRFGSIDVCVNCAGIPASTKALDRNGEPHGAETFRRAIAVNLFGTFNVMSHCAAAMRHNAPTDDGERGVVINVASIAAFEGLVGDVAYSASKAGVLGMMLPAAREFASIGVRVLSIAPGLFLTPMAGTVRDNVLAKITAAIGFPKRSGHLGEFASLVAYMCENAYLNAECIRLDAATRL